MTFSNLYLGDCALAALEILKSCLRGSEKVEDCLKEVRKVGFARLLTLCMS